LVLLKAGILEVASLPSSLSVFGEVAMSAVSFPSGILKAEFNVPSLSDIPGNPLAPPVPTSNPHFIPNDPCLPVIEHLFGFGDGGDLLGVAPHTDLSSG
jgi:hypothetical protein